MKRTYVGLWNRWRDKWRADVKLTVSRWGV